MLNEFPITLVRPLEWGEMDAFNHLNNAVYFRFFENARIAYFGQIKILEEMQQSGVGPILKSTSCVYRVQLVYPDTVVIGARVSEIKEDRFVMKYAIYSQKHQRLAAVGEGVIVSLNYRKNEKAPLSKSVIRAIEELEHNKKKGV